MRPRWLQQLRLPMKLGALGRSNETSYQRASRPPTTPLRAPSSPGSHCGKASMPRVSRLRLRCTGMFQQASQASWYWRTTGPSTRVLGLFICQDKAIRRDSATPSAVRAKEYSFQRVRRTPVDDCCKPRLKPWHRCKAKLDTANCAGESSLDGIHLHGRARSRAKRQRERPC